METEIKPWQCLHDSDPEIFRCMEEELQRQRHGIELIASENFASKNVILAMANVFTNKYAEGLPGRRYYGGCGVVDEMENICRQRAKDLFSANYANVQPHSGASANEAVMMALVPPGGKVLGMDLSHGGHLTHGSPVNFSGHYYKAHFYGLDPQSETIDYDKADAIAQEVKPDLIIAGASAYPREIDFSKFADIANRAGALLMVDMAHIAGLVAAGVHPSPIPHAHVCTTTTHKTLRGPRGGLILCQDGELSKKINKAVFPGMQGGPLEHIIAAKAVCFKEATQPGFKEYQEKVVANAKAMAERLAEHGLKLVSGGTDNHLMLIDLSKSIDRVQSLSGKDLELRLGTIGITVNKNTVPGEQRSPFVTSGIRVGTPAITTRGMGLQDVREIADLIFEACVAPDEKIESLHSRVQSLADRFPHYPGW